ncbi:MAG: NADH-quinone oxidoreductase subunit C [Chloroflexota bacterium]
MSADGMDGDPSKVHSQKAKEERPNGGAFNLGPSTFDTHNAGPSTLDAQDVPEAMRRLRDEGYVRFVDLTVVDEPARVDRFELNYLLYHMDQKEWVRVKARTDGTAPSVTGIFAGANAYEREAYDMFGIAFEGHPMLHRILMPDDWVGHPLRRDEPIGGEEVDFTTRRGPHGD